MPRFQFELARPEDDAELRQLLARNVMPGSIALSFEREPSFLDALKIEGPFQQVIICRDTHNQRIVGIGTRSIRERYYETELEPVGYLSSLRLDRDYRNMGLVARGFRFLRELDGDQRTQCYVTTITEGNAVAEKTLLGARLGLPVYRRIGSWATLSLSLRRFRNKFCSGVKVRPAMAADVPQIVTFINEHGSDFNLFPHYTELDFLHNEGTFRGLDLSHIFLAEEAGKLMGTFAVWDQAGFKQTMVHDYARWLKWLRPFHNAWANWRGDPILPACGERLQAFIGAILIVAENRVELAQALLAAAAHQQVPQPSRLLLGFDARCPLGQSLAHEASHCYNTGIYLVSWNCARLDAWNTSRTLYLELGCL